MRIKEIFPWKIETPIIHLVQPSPTIPLGHEVVSVQSSENGRSNSIFTLAAQGEGARKQRKVKKERRGSNLSCGYISPSLNLEPPGERRRSSFYDLRVNRSVVVEGDAVVNRSKSVDEGQGGALEKRKTSPDFEDILRDLTCESRLSSDTTDSVTSKASSISEHSKSDISKRCLTNKPLSSSESAFFDISLDEPELEQSSSSPQLEVTPRKSFSEETFDRNRLVLFKQRDKMLEQVAWKSKPRSSSTDSWDSQEDIWGKMNASERRRVSQMVDDLLLEIYGDKTTRPLRRRSCLGIVRQYKSSQSEDHYFDSLCEDSCHMEQTSSSDSCRLHYLQKKGVEELRDIRQTLQTDVKRLGSRLVKQLVQRDCYLAKRDWHSDWITAYLQANSEKRSEDTKTRFSVSPSPGDSGFTQWQNGMRAVARLPEGIPPQFRKTLWLNLAEKHLVSRGVKWEQVEEFCFNEFTNPDDEELGVQIVKDVHRTGCSLFCGVSGKENQALLKRVLLAYARWNKAVGYCQGFNMLAALILQVMGKSEVDSVKVMIYLIEGVLPESYFANNLRGLSVDMAVFRDLLRLKLPTLSRHFDQLQCDSKDSGTSYEPPLTNVFTMQWFLTLFCNCLPQETVLRVWDLIFLEGNHVLLCTALAIWSTLADRILTVESADEFYCIMGVLTREMLEFGLMDANALIKAIVSFNLPELAELREKYLYNITPWTQSVSTVAKRGLRLFYSDEDTDTEEDDEKIAIATAYGLFRSPKKKEGTSGVTSPPRSLAHPDKEKIAMDISALTKQYRKLRERQKQAHVILTAACGSQSLVGPTASPAMNHLLMGKFALVNSKGRRLGPPPGSIPPPSQPRPLQGEKQKIVISGETLHWKDAVNSKKPQQRDSGSDEEKSPESSRHSSRRSSSSSTSTELCDDPQRLSDSETNSLSETCNPADKTEPSTPLKTLQVKASHPDDIASCKEETEETLEKYNQEEIRSPVELEVITKEDTLSITPKEDSRSITPEGEEPRRKTSFRIDPEELRQLDRKLSLKIVEIERRKSSAGIESEDLDSVLFSFDRDYIQEGKRTDRDTPSSIPDDRLCSTDDFVCEFEEETIVVPDLITTHKPLRMSSLEECDETKAVEMIDDEMDENELYEGEEDFKSNPDYLSSDENEEENPLDTKYNFDELFNKKNIVSTEKYLNESISSTNVNNVANYLTTSSENDQINLKSEPYTPPAYNVDITNIISGDSINQLCTDLPRNPQNQLKDVQLSKSDLPPNENNMAFEEKENTGITVQKTRSNVLGESSSNMLLDNSELKVSNFNEVSETSENTTVAKEKTSNLNDSRSKLERKLAHLLPSMSMCSSFDNLPDVAVVTSRDAEINLIREKYAKGSKETTGLSVDTLEPIHLPKSFTFNHGTECKPNTTAIEEGKPLEGSLQSKSSFNTNESSIVESREEINNQSELCKNIKYAPMDEGNTVNTTCPDTNYAKESETLEENVHLQEVILSTNHKIKVVLPLEEINLSNAVSVKRENIKDNEKQENLQTVCLKKNIEEDNQLIGNVSQVEPSKSGKKFETCSEKNIPPVNKFEIERDNFICHIANGRQSTTSEMGFESRIRESPNLTRGSVFNEKIAIEKTVHEKKNEVEKENTLAEIPNESDASTTVDRFESKVAENCPNISKESKPGSKKITVHAKLNEIKTEQAFAEGRNEAEGLLTSEGHERMDRESSASGNSSPSSKRRGSEVALDLILKENLHILSKIQQQNRRKSEICIDSTDRWENSATTADSNKKLESKDILEQDLITLSRDILENLGSKIEKVPFDRSTVSDNGTENSTQDSPLINKNHVQSEKTDANINPLSSAVLFQEGDEKSLHSKQISKIPSFVAEKSLPTVNLPSRDHETKTSISEYKSDFYSFENEHNPLQNLSERSGSSVTSKELTNEGSEGFVNKGFIESYRYSIGSHAVPPMENDDALTISQANLPSEKQSCFRENPFISSRFPDSSTDFQAAPKSYSSKATCHEEIFSRKIATDDLADTNEDIDQELRSLDIKPEEILEYDDLIGLPTGLSSSDKLCPRRRNPSNDELTEFKLSPEDPTYKLATSKYSSLDHLPEKAGSRPCFHSMNQRAISLDTTSFGKVSNDSCLDDKRKLFARSTTLDDDNLLYLNSYKSHGRSLIEKGELDTLKTLKEETGYTDRIHCNNGNPSDISEESASDFKVRNDSELYKPYSHVLSRDSKVSQLEKKESEDNKLSRYKTYSPRSVSPSRYRFSSASPVRKKLDTQSEPSPSSYVGTNRVKSPSPTCYSSSRSLSSKDECLQSEGVRSEYRNSKEYKKYSRTESLDLNFRSEWANTYLKKRAESVEISTLEHLHEDRKSLSPTSPVKFNPFPIRNASRQPKELGVKLGLYLPPKSDKSPSKRLT